MVLYHSDHGQSRITGINELLASIGGQIKDEAAIGFPEQPFHIENRTGVSAVFPSVEYAVSVQQENRLSGTNADSKDLSVLI